MEEGKEKTEFPRRLWKANKTTEVYCNKSERFGSEMNDVLFSLISAIEREEIIIKKESEVQRPVLEALFPKDDLETSHKKSSPQSDAYCP
ncbi:hypothetical protein TNCV_1950491 [Trichonephila clavipes]|nr:hypothetical protein TNCV_1950491 [Trichonephila clavipes]